MPTNTRSVEDTRQPRRPGRPRVHVAPRRDLHILLPEADVDAIEALPDTTVTDFIAAAVREKLARAV